MLAPCATRSAKSFEHLPVRSDLFALRRQLIPLVEVVGPAQVASSEWDSTGIDRQVAQRAATATGITRAASTYEPQPEAAPCPESASPPRPNQPGSLQGRRGQYPWGQCGFRRRQARECIRSLGGRWDVAGMGSVIKKRRKRMAKKKHRKLLKRTRVQRRNK